MIIKDVKGTRYSISKTRISELPFENLSRYVVFAEYRASKASGEETTPVRYRGESSEVSPNPLFDHGPTCLGCRTFRPRTFAKILKAAGVKPVRKTKPAKKGKK